jgi:hypothetical protein
MVVMRPAAPVTVAGPISPASPVFDPFWARINEAGIAVVVHAGDSGYTAHGYARDGFTTDFAGIPQPIRMLQLERPIEDFLASLVCDRLFDRFPRVRVASVENGSRFLGGLFDRLRIVSHKMSAGSRRIRSRRCAATCGSTRSGRTTCANWCRSWCATGDLRQRLAPTSRDSRSRWSTASNSTASTTRAAPRSWVATPQRC